MRADQSVQARFGGVIGDVSPAEWNRAAGREDPFVGHAFLSALEHSGSVGGETGWQSFPLAVGQGYAPLWLKAHSLGEYVFDQGWAEGWIQAGGRYYPKLLLAVPFTPVPGPRLLGAADDAVAMIAAMEAFSVEHGLSSAHATFLQDRDLGLFRDAGWLIREGLQFHWPNRGYRDYQDFLETFTARKRKAVRKERLAARANVDIHCLTGSAIDDRAMAHFWACYQATAARKWGQPYLTRAFFDEIVQTLADRLLLVVAERDGHFVAAALNVIGQDALYGRYWGMLENLPFLHFELCYHQAIDWAIHHGLARVEAGAQGEHKLARGYVPVRTHSAHFLPHPGFRAAVARFLDHERPAVRAEQQALIALGPYRADGVA